MFYKGEIPFVRLILPFVLGIITAWNSPEIFNATLIFYLPAVLLVCLGIGLMVYKRFKLYLYRWFFGILIHLFLFLLAYLHTAYQTGRISGNYFHQLSAKTLVIKVSNEPIIHGDIMRLEADVCYADWKKVKGKLLIALKLDTTQALNLAYGDLLAIPAVYHELEPPYNPGEFNYKRFLKTRQIEHQCFINQQELKKLGSNFGNPLIGFALRLRQKIIQRFKEQIPNPEAASLASTLIMGYRADLSPEILSAYAKTGTMHVLSVSGMHVALVFLMLSFLLKPLDKIPRMRILKAFILIGMIWFYALITGFSPSVNRAALMLSFVVLGKAIDKSMNTYNLLAISAFILLLIYPLYLFDIGFQLSYLAVLGLVFLHPPIYGLFYFRSKIIDPIWSYTALSLAAQIITFPLSVFIFHQFPVYFLLSNLLIVIPATLIMYAGVTFVLLLPFKTFLPALLGIVLNYLINFTNQALYFIEKLPFSSLQGIVIHWNQLILLYLLLLGLLFAWIFKNKLCLFFGLFSALIFCGLSTYNQFQSRQTRQIIFYSLRKNYAVGYINGRNIQLFSDLNPKDKAYQFSIKPSLEQFNMVQLADTSIRKNYLQFGEYRLLRWTADYNYKTYFKTIKVNALMLSGNPKISIDQLKKWVKFSVLLIDGTNPDYKIKIWTQQAEQYGINYYVLKKNPALVVSL